MKQLKLDTILIFALVIPFIMTYRISWGDTPYWLFGLIFFCLFLYVFLDLPVLTLKQSVCNIVKTVLLWCIIFMTIGAAVLSAIIVRHQTAPIFGVHDIVLQQEAAIRFFLHGKNPYAATYFGTPLEQWHYSDTEINPALYHFVMQPVYLIFPVPFYLFMGHIIGFFDARVPLFILLIALLLLASLLQKNPERSREFLILLAFNPSTLPYFIEGRDDIFMFAFLFAAWFFLYKKNELWGGVCMALAFATKQSVWPLFPFYVAYLYYEKKSVKETLISLIPFALICTLFIIPFFIWNPQAYLASTIFYLSGNTAHSYPVAGYGLGALLHQFGIIKDVHAYYPFWIWELIIAVPLLFLLLRWQQKENSIQRMIILYGLFLFVFWYLSRYFNNSHLGYLSMVFITAYFWPSKTLEG